MLDNILGILNRAIDKNNTNINPTLLYNEGWMLRLVQDWFKNNPSCKHELSIPQDCLWYSEAYLPSPFLTTPGLRLSEGYTHADGVAGKFEIGKVSKGELSLKPDCDYFYVAEAKIYSSLSTGTTNAKDYNQAARNIACIADLLVRSNLTSNEFKKLAFYVLIPEDHPDLPNIKSKLEPGNIIDSINKRISCFPQDFDNKVNSISWIRDNIKQFVENKIEIDIITWEEILIVIGLEELKDFYCNCLEFNKTLKKAQT